MIMYEQMLDGVNVMFNNKIKIFLITLVFMLSISAVAAVESNTTDDMIAGEVDEEPPSGVVQDVSNDKSIGVTNDDLEKSDGVYELSGNDLKMYYKNGSSYDVTLLKDSKPVKNASLSVVLNGVTYKKVTNNLGKVSIPINLKVGSYVVSTTYDNINVKNNIKVLPVIVSGKDITTTYKSTAKYSPKFLDGKGKPLANKNVKFKVNGKTYTKKTNAKGIASFSISSLKVGTFTIYAIHPNGYSISNKIVVKHSVVASNLVKHYGSYKKFSATFYGKNGKPLANKYIQFYRKGDYFNVKTNSKGVASITVISSPQTFKMISINPETGQKLGRNVTILSTLSASKVSTFSDKTTAFKVKLYKNEKLVKNAKVYVYVNGVKKPVKLMRMELLVLISS